MISTWVLVGGLIIAGILMILANLLLAKGNTIMEKQQEACCAGECSCMENNKEILEKVNLNDVMVEITKLEGGAESISIAQVKEVCKILNDYVGDNVIYDNLKLAYHEKVITKAEAKTDGIERVSEES